MAPRPDLSTARRHALVVATGEYTDPAFTQLRGPAQDAADIIDILGHPGLGAFTVAPPVIDRPAYEILLRIEDFLRNRNRDDLTLVYLSCHGVLDGAGELYFVATNTKRDCLFSTAVKASWLGELLDKYQTRQQVLILDCCYAAANGRIKSDTDLDLRRRLIGDDADPRGRAILSSSRSVQPSKEDPLPPGGAIRSVFTFALVEGIRSGDADRYKHGYISPKDAHDYAADWLGTSKYEQKPVYEIRHGEGEIILARSPHGASSMATATLPEELWPGLESQDPKIRRAAVAALAAMLASPDPEQALAARQMLQVIALTDSPTVASDARQALRPEQPPTAAPTVGHTASTHSKAKHSTDQRPSSIIPCRCFQVIQQHRQGGSGTAWWGPRVTFSPDGRLLASTNGATVQLWDPSTGRAVGLPLKDHGLIRAVAFSPDGQRLATASQRSVWLRDLSTGQVVQGVKSYTGGFVQAIAFSPDGRLLATGAQFDLGDDEPGEPGVGLWDWTTRQLIGVLAGHLGYASAVTFSPDGRLLATGGQGPGRLWDLATRKEPFTYSTPIAYLRSHNKSADVTKLAFSPDGRLLASTSGPTVRLWDPTGQPFGQPLADRSATGHTEHVTAIAFSPDSRLLASANGRIVCLWNVLAGQPVGRLIGHKNSVQSLAFSPDGQLLASGSEDNTILLWGQ